MNDKQEIDALFLRNKKNRLTMAANGEWICVLYATHMLIAFIYSNIKLLYVVTSTGIYYTALAKVRYYFVT